MNKLRQGSTFIIVIGILGIILFASTLFMSSTIDEGRHTAMSVRGLHATCLAEAAVERAMKIIASQANDIDVKTTPKDSLAVLLRLPAKVKSGSAIGASDNLGADDLLELGPDLKKEIVFTKDDLQADDPPNGKELDNLVSYMTSDGAKEYKVEVKMSVDKAFKMSPGKEFPNYKVPGVEVGWNLRPDVEKFLSGNGYSPFEFKFPPTMSWLGFSIPIKVGPITLININVTGIIDSLMPKITIDGKEMSFKDLTSIDFFAKEVINKLFGAEGTAYQYPFTFKFDKVEMPKSIAELWPSGVSLINANDAYLEKYGQIKIECEASISYKNGYTSKRRVSAVKEFKVADCEPPAPMYSFFISNLANNYIAFNNYGGQFIVNNFDYGGTWGKVKDLLTGTTAKLSDDDLLKREYPGLIRVNYNDTTGKKPLVVNVGIVGDWGAPDMAGGDSLVKKIFSGVDAMLIIDSRMRMAVAGGSYNVNAEIVKRPPGSNTSIPAGMAGNQTNSGPTNSPPFNKYGVSFQNKLNVGHKGTMDLLNSFAGVPAINMMPNVGKMSTNVIALSVTLALKPMLDKVVSASIAMVPDCFQRWEMPYMGTSNWLYTIPTHGVGMNKTHLFGAGALYPTLSREIEGDVLKKYRQWKMCIVGMNPLDRLPLLPFPPFLLPPPPIVVPIWSSAEILAKYDYNLDSLKARAADGSADLITHSYDPSKLENMPPNLYTNEQYIKKATYFYKDFAAFMEDYPNRLIDISGKKVLVLNGVTYISGSMGSSSKPFDPNGDGKFYVTGRGMIVCSGNIFLGCDIETLDKSDTDRTVYSTITRSGGLIILDGGKARVVEGSLYTDKGIYINADSSLHIIGNWVTNQFNKFAMGGKVVVDFVSSKVRSSMGSLHPIRGKYDPKRYHVSFSPTWASWRED